MRRQLRGQSGKLFLVCSLLCNMVLLRAWLLYENKAEDCTIHKEIPNVREEEVILAQPAPVVAAAPVDVAPLATSSSPHLVGGAGESEHEGLRGFSCPPARPPSILHVIDNTMKAVEGLACVKLAKLNPLTKICIHNLKEDIYVSQQINAGGYWEKGNIEFMIKVLNDDPGLHLIDIGANIGEYSLVAARMKRRVLAVEARLLHVHMLVRSSQLNGFQDNITIVHNALSDGYARVQMGTYKENQGGTYVNASKSENFHPGVDAVQQPSDGTKTPTLQDVKKDMSADSIIMNDLAELVRFPKALLKMDIEGFELKAIRCQLKLFKKVFVPVIMMEWVVMKKLPGSEIEPLIEWFQQQGYKSYELMHGLKLKQREFSDFRNWQNNIVLKHKDYNP